MQNECLAIKMLAYAITTLDKHFQQQLSVTYELISSDPIRCVWPQSKSHGKAVISKQVK